LGRLLVNLKCDNEAIENLKFALDYWTEQGDIFRIARASNNLGIVYDRNRDFQKAESYYTTALEKFDQLGSYAAICSLTFNMATSAFDRSEWEAANTWLKKSYYIADEILDDAYLRVSRLIHLGESEYFLGRYDLANKSFLIVLGLIEGSMDSYRLAQISILIGITANKIFGTRSSSLEAISNGLSYFDSQHIKVPLADEIIESARELTDGASVQLPDFGFDDQFSACKKLLTL
jgi:tetratricopeptide (TPR) repeat protein